jgi:single-strand DNA-binding protein
MYDYDKVYILGNLTKDPVLRNSSEGNIICDMRIAVNSKWYDKSGFLSENVEFFNVTAWNKQAKNCIDSLVKGDRVMVCGHLNNSAIEDEDQKNNIRVLNINADSVAASLEFNSVKILKSNTL